MGGLGLFFPDFQYSIGECQGGQFILREQLQLLSIDCLEAAGTVFDGSVDVYGFAEVAVGVGRKEYVRSSEV